MGDLKKSPRARDVGLFGTGCFSKGALAKHGTAHNDLVTTGAVAYAIDGVLYSKAAVTTIDVSTLYTPTAQPAGKTRVYLLTLDAAGNIGVVEGADVANGGTALYPALPSGRVGFGAVHVVNATASNFVFGTTNLNAADITATYKDLSRVPRTW